MPRCLCARGARVRFQKHSASGQWLQVGVVGRLGARG